jgi:mRNA-degrading endonuclease HigB of HigAB toxin-antitoxin module
VSGLADESSVYLLQDPRVEAHTLSAVFICRSSHCSHRGNGYHDGMRVFNLDRATLKAYWSTKGREDSKGSLAAWFKETKAAKEGPADVKARYATASCVGNDRIVFNICGNTRPARPCVAAPTHHVARAPV